MMDELLAEFLAETVENVETVDRRVACDRAGAVSGAAAAEVFRMTAAIGATARFLEIPRLQSVAGAAEGLALGLRDGRMVAPPGAEALLLAAVRRIDEIARAMLVSGAEPGGGDEDLVHGLANAAAQASESR